MSKTILVLGAGTGGVVAAVALSKKLGKSASILVFEKETNHVFAPSLLWLMVGKRKANKIHRPTKNITRQNLKLITGTIEKIDPENKIISINGKDYRGDYMIISLGAETFPEKELNHFGHNFYTLEGAEDFNQQLTEFKGGKIAVLVPSLPFKCPAAPYEAAMLVADAIKRKNLNDKTEISLYTPEGGPMPVAGVALSGAVRHMLLEKGITYHPEHNFLGIKDGEMIFADKKHAAFDLLAYTPKHQCPSVLVDAGLTGNSGWIEVNRHTMETRFPDVYAIGDNTHIPLEMGKPLPKAGVFAHYQAEIVADSIIKKTKGISPDKIFEGNGQCFLEQGAGKAGYAGGNFYGSPLPEIKMKKPAYFWHWTKVWFEKFWFYKYF